MTGSCWTDRNRGISRRFARDDTGAAMVEFALIMALFFFLIFAIIDFGRLLYTINFAERAAYVAARIAVVRPVACDTATDFPNRFEVNPSASSPRYGTNCRDASDPCDDYTHSCVGNTGNATVAEIWDRIAPLMPGNATAADLTFTYSTDANQALGYLGGPFTPMVTVDVSLDSFTFLSPLGALINLAGATGSTLGGTLALPTYSVSMPAEDLNVGSGG